MAARLRPHHQDDVKKKIQAAHLVKLLQDDALGKLNPELTPGRRDSAKFLLNKTISNAPTEITGENGGPLQVQEVPWLKTRRL
jgi:hypothetical protein